MAKDKKSGTIPENKHLSGKEFETIQKDKHFKVIGNNESRIYEYTIYDSKGNAVDHGDVKNRPPTITYISGNIIEIRFNNSIYADTCKYYNIKANTFSNFFLTPFLVTDKKIVYYDGKNLIVQDIFDKKVFYKEFPIDMIPTGPPEYIKFIDNGQKLKMKYMRESDNQYETQTFDLE